MPINQATLRRSSQTFTAGRTLNEARRSGAPTAFLSHSHKDAVLAKGLQVYLRQQGWNVYIDWEDTAMPDRPNRETADRIRRKIVDFDLFLFLATYNSMTSRWCPWELGYADGKKMNDSILIVQTTDDHGASYGSEYLQLYRRVDNATGGGVGAFDLTGSGPLLTGTIRP